MPPQNINPFERKKQPVAPAADPEKQKELLRRVAGATALPPPAKALPGVTGTPPLPTGKIVGHVAPSALTEIERQTLEATGWTPDIGLPSSQEGLKQLQDAVATQLAATVPLPYDPRNPPAPLNVKTVPIESLDEAKRAKIREALKTTVEGITAQERSDAAAKNNLAQLQAKETTVKGSAGAQAAALKAAEIFRQRVEAETNTPLVDEAPVEPFPEPKPAAPRAKETPTQPSDTGAANATLTHCPHCSWDLSVPDVQDPTHAEKMAFVHCLAGDKQYSKEMPLFNGAIVVTFRSLAIREIDKIAAQTFQERKNGEFASDLDYWERFNRYRLMLQLQSVRTYGDQPTIKDLPDGYSASTNPNAVAYWVTAKQESEFTPDQTGLPDIATWITENVLKSEAIFRAANNSCNQFNRIAARLEAMADNEDFWKPTGEQS